jgi:hypothetical protein
LRAKTDRGCKAEISNVSREELLKQLEAELLTCFGCNTRFEKKRGLKTHACPGSIVSPQPHIEMDPRVDTPVIIAIQALIAAKEDMERRKAQIFERRERDGRDREQIMADDAEIEHVKGELVSLLIELC